MIKEEAPFSLRTPVDERPVRIVSAQQSVVSQFKSIWETRELLRHLVFSEIKIKYKASKLGVVWSMFNPALTLAIYYLVFHIIVNNGVPQFVIFLSAGLLVWNFVINSVSTSTGIVVDRAGIVKKVAFPREILAFSTIGTSLVYFGIQLGVTALYMIIVHQAPIWSMLWILPISLLALCLICGAIGLFLSAVNVYMRDTRHFVDVFLMLWFWLTPIVYSYQHTVATKLHSHILLGIHLNDIFFINPVTPIVMTFQKVLYAHAYVRATTPDHSVLNMLPNWSEGSYVTMNLILVGVGAAALLAALKIFGRLEGNFAEEL